MRQCYEWQVGQPKVGSWTEELDTAELGEERQNAGETICHVIGTRCNDIQRQKRVAEIRNKC
jgi:hypothetical protein